MTCVPVPVCVLQLWVALIKRIYQEQWPIESIDPILLAYLVDAAGDDDGYDDLILFLSLTNIIVNNIDYSYLLFTECPCDIMAKVLDCDIIVSEFEFHWRYHVHVWERYEPAYPPCSGLGSTTTVLL